MNLLIGRGLFCFRSHHFPLDFITACRLTFAWRWRFVLVVCARMCVYLSHFEKKGGETMLIVTSVLLSLIALYPLSLCSHRVPLHLPLSLWLFYFVFQWTFIAPLNLNPSLSPCTGYSLLPSNFLYAFPYTNCKFSHTRHLYSVAHYDFLLPLASPLCVQLDIIVPLYSVFWIGK